MSAAQQRLSAGWVLVGAALLEVCQVLFIQGAARTSQGVSVDTGQQVFWTALDLALIWATWRRSRAARYALVLLIAVPMTLVLVSAINIGWFKLGLLALAAAQLTALFAPQVRSHMKSGRVVARG